MMANGDLEWIRLARRNYVATSSLAAVSLAAVIAELDPAIHRMKNACCEGDG